jgi:hypothetical protein
MKTTQKPAPAPTEAQASLLDAAAAVSPEAVATVEAQAVLGIDYTDTFTLEDAIRSFNATRQAITLPSGEVLPAERQQFRLGTDWLAKHQGTFTVRRPSIYDEIKMRASRDQLGLEGVELSAATDWLVDATIVAKHLVAQAPEWFKLDEPGLDSDVVYMLHHWYIQWSRTFR